LVEQEPPLEEHEAAAAAAELRVERVVVHAQLLVAADGPLSPIRQQLVGDGPPQFDVSAARSLLHCYCYSHALGTLTGT
jgi:2-polyprenyl-6-methoxyphenol hydroxylase-like FAD-dependent oxidoreductase